MKTVRIVLPATVLLPLFVPVSHPGAQTEAADDTVKILVAYYSRTGHTEALAKAVAEGARRVKPASVSLKSVSEVKCPELLGTDALVVGSPVYWSNMAGEVKTFFDRWTTDCGVLPPAFPMKDKIGAAFVTAGETASGQEVTMMTILAAMLGNRMIVLSEAQALGATATTGEGKAPLGEQELQEGRRLGERVAQEALIFKRGRRLTGHRSPALVHEEAR